ncbi:hypothetical protein [Delftia tsuruhatensis]|uniref:hypothetical protein n=1 Tax=Delftia tsuruhatensis TaxID=180282 RepID=UPI001EF5CFD1|nr:hypothetical protein [Delftia tsuruhatensis]
MVFEVKKYTGICAVLLPAMLMAGCFWFEDPWFGDASVAQVDGVPCFGMPNKEISDPKKTKISLILVMKGNYNLWKYDENNYKQMILANNTCTPYGTDVFHEPSSENRVGNISELTPGDVYRVLIRTTQAQNSFNRTFYYANFCYRRRAGGEMVVYQLESVEGISCPEGE